MKFLLFLFSILCVGCFNRIVPLKHDYLTSNFEKTIDKPKARVWSNLLEYFKRNGLTVRILDSSSGLIKLDPTNLLWSYENKKGDLSDPAAWVAVERVIYKNKLLALSNITGEWNIRVRDTRDGGTYFVIDLVNLKYNTPSVPSYQPFLRATPRSTGVFERTMYEGIK